MVDETARLLPFEPIIDAIKGGFVGRDASVGIAQVKLATANNLIKKGLYNPNPDDKELPFKTLNDGARIYLYRYVAQPRHNIFFSAAFIRSLVDEWRKKIDLAKKPEIIATLYHREHIVPHSDLLQTTRSQIAGFISWRNNGFKDYDKLLPFSWNLIFYSSSTYGSFLI